MLQSQEFNDTQRSPYQISGVGFIFFVGLKNGTEIAVALNDKNDLPYGVVHFCTLKEINEYQANAGGKNQPSNTGDNSTDMQNKASVVQLNIDDHSLVLYLNERSDVIDYSVPEGSDDKITSKLNRDIVVGRYFADT